uniref:Uncharacterized protein n=1 Tax=Branchiostoma floridae TaxID=7739 RepID=C3YGJ5_BRAFL|eukprot:XP_002604494.1 hypothetical protein BRAFLDRAFT_79207 [Branchiostoma floridae]
MNAIYQKGRSDNPSPESQHEDNGGGPSRVITDSSADGAENKTSNSPKRHHSSSPKAKRKKISSSPPGPSGMRTRACAQGSRHKPVVLMINDEYGTAKGGTSTIHRQMACLMASKGAKVYSTVLQANMKDKEDADADGVHLIVPKVFEGDDRKPDLKWLTFDHHSRYPELPPNVDFIVGHVNITSGAARQIKQQRLSGAKLVQVTHVIPEDVARYKSKQNELSIEEEKAGIQDDLKDADVIVSVGPRLYDYYKSETRKDEHQDHHEFLPKPSDIFQKMQVKYIDTETKVVLSIGRVKGVEVLKGYDLVAKSMVKVIDELPNAKWRAHGIRPEDFADSKEITQDNTSIEFMPFTPLKYGTQEELSRDMQQAHVVLMPSRAEPFGLVGLEAIAAGVPVLVSHKSGLAWFLGKNSDFDRPIVDIEDDDEEAVKTLSKRIVKVLKEGRKEFDAARKLKMKLLRSNYWDGSHKKFLEIFGL